MDLLRLPLIVLKDVFKNMEFREQFLISSMSKRARSILKLTSVKFDFLFIFEYDFFINWSQWPSYLSKTALIAPELCIGGEKMRMSVNSDGIILSGKLARKHLPLIAHLLDTLGKPTFSVQFHDPTEPASVLKFMKAINKRKESIESFKYYSPETSSELVPRILDECTEVTDCIYINILLPKDFVYTPPRPFKAKELHVRGGINWIHPESFVNCANIIVLASHDPKQTAQCWSSFLNKWMGSDTRLQKLWFNFFQRSDMKSITEALNNLGTLRKLDRYWIEVKRMDGMEFFIDYRYVYIAIYTKQAYLEKLKEDEEGENLR
uniref:F-box domain-containing protein n=1 Tax=Caenorhabditis tropicalis TaxID=1561998 RepID=A0A1I7UTK6_9PELO